MFVAGRASDEKGRMVQRFLNDLYGVNLRTTQGLNFFGRGNNFKSPTELKLVFCDKILALCYRFVEKM